MPSNKSASAAEHSSSVRHKDSQGLCRNDFLVPQSKEHCSRCFLASPWHASCSYHSETQTWYAQRSGSTIPGEVPTQSRSQVRCPHNHVIYVLQGAMWRERYIRTHRLRGRRVHNYTTGALNGKNIEISTELVRYRVAHVEA